MHGYALTAEISEDAHCLPYSSYHSIITEGRDNQSTILEIGVGVDTVPIEIVVYFICCLLKTNTMVNTYTKTNTNMEHLI